MRFRLDWSFVAVLVLATTLIGLTDAVTAVWSDQRALDQPTAAAPKKSTTSRATNGETPNALKAEVPNYVIRGSCIDQEDRSPLAGMQVRLFKVQGRGSPPVEVAKVLCNGEGRFEFSGLASPRREDRIDPLFYEVFAISDDRPIGIGGIQFPTDREPTIRVGRKKTTLSGTVVNAKGHPIAGATVMQDY